MKVPERVPADNVLWAKFAKTYWEKKAVCLKNVKSPIFKIDSTCIFKLLVRYSDHCRKTQSDVGIKFYIEGHRQYLDEVLVLLPVAKDKSLKGYHRRMSEMFSDYALVCDELISFAKGEWDLLGSFVLPLYKHVGFPTRFAEMGLYLGNYRTTPFGVHVDGCGVFSFPVEGTKKFRVWPSTFIKKYPVLKQAHRYEAFKKYSKQWVVRPGDIAYWPSSYWHIAESNGSFNATWSIGVWLDKNLPTLPFRTLWRSDGFVEEVPHGHKSSKRGTDAALRDWLKLISKYGFRNAPFYDRSHPVRKNQKPKVLWANLSNGRLCVAINGVLLERPKSWIKLIQQINQGKKESLVNSLYPKSPAFDLSLP